MTQVADLAGRYYRLGLAAAKRRDVSLALRCAERACVLEALARNGAPPDSGAQRLAEICRYELGGERGAFENAAMERAGVLAGQKKWRAAAEAAESVSRPSARLLNIQGCLWALANRRGRAADCFTKALAKDRGNRLAADALVETGKRRIYFWRFF